MKTYILDTTVLLYDAGALFAFGDNNVVVPVTVIEEIDRFKKDISETGRNARQVSRILDGLRREGALTTGVALETGGSLFVRTASTASLRRIPEDFTEKRRDGFIFGVALDEKERGRGVVTLVTKDVCLRIKADSIGIDAQDYESERIDFDELYSGHAVCVVESSVVSRLVNRQPVEPPRDLYANQYVTLVDSECEENVAYGRFDASRNAVVPLIPFTQNVNLRIKVRNAEQAFALDALLNDSIELVTLVGKAGTGKTLLAVAASIYKTVDENIYNRILVSRPTLPMGKDIGFLPGTVEEKLTPWMYPIADNVELLMRQDTGRAKMRSFKEMVEMGLLIIEPLTYIRGRSIHSQFLIVDEAQNLTPHEIKTIITRVGAGTKIVLTGDPYQIDNPYIDSSSNGLTVVVEKFKRQQVAGHVTMTKGERSVLSELAANLL